MNISIARPALVRAIMSSAEPSTTPEGTIAHLRPNLSSTHHKLSYKIEAPYVHRHFVDSACASCMLREWEKAPYAKGLYDAVI